VDLYPYAFALIGVGSGAIHLPCLQFANLFPGSERTAVLLSRTLHHHFIRATALSQSKRLAMHLP
jgi:hypothetical protein